MLIRTEEAKDYKDVYFVNYEAFGGRDDESRLVERIRDSVNFIPELSIVAEVEGKIVGHLLFSKAQVRDESNRHDVIVLAPIAIKPNHQKMGIGGKLIREGLSRCKEMGFPLVLLIGHPAYYPKFGFKPARQFQLQLRQFHVSDDVFMVYEVQEGALENIQGELLYPDAFF